MLNRRELSEKLHRRNAAQVAYNNGEIEEEYLKNALDKAMKGVEVEEMGGDYFEPIYSAQGAPQGKVFLSRKPKPLTRLLLHLIKLLPLRKVLN